MTSKAKTYWPTYAILGVITLIFSGLSLYIYLEISSPTQSVITTTSNVSVNKVEVTEGGDEISWQTIYPDTKPMQIGSVTVQASVAETWSDRITGLSGTPYLPEEVVKLFMFDSSGYHSIWMKDMNYSIDIIWVSEDGVVVHMEPGASPASFPAMFVPETPAKYVIETVEGFVLKNKLTLGDTVVLPNL